MPGIKSKSDKGVKVDKVPPRKRKLCLSEDDNEGNGVHSESVSPPSPSLPYLPADFVFGAKTKEGSIVGWQGGPRGRPIYGRSLRSGPFPSKRCSVMSPIVPPPHFSKAVPLESLIIFNGKICSSSVCTYERRSPSQNSVATETPEMIATATDLDSPETSNSTQAQSGQETAEKDSIGWDGRNGEGVDGACTHGTPRNAEKSLPPLDSHVVPSTNPRVVSNT